MFTLPPFMPAAAQAAFRKAIQDAVAAAVPYLVVPGLDDQQRKSLNPRTTGPESVGFIQDANQMLQSHREILPRSITDQVVAEFPARITQFNDYTGLIQEINKALRPLLDARLLTGVHLRDTAREAHATARRDDGKTPGVSEILARLDAHTAIPNPKDDSDEPNAPQG